jgi:hypothetical protein
MNPPLAGRKRALIDQRRLEPAPQIGAEIDPRFDRTEQIALPRGQPGLDRRQASQRPPEKTQVARRRPAGRHARQEPLHVVCLAERLLQVFSQGRVCHELFHGVEPRANRARYRSAGLAIHSANRREPIGVTEWSSTASREPSRRPSRIVREISRLRRLASSISSVSPAPVGQQAVDVLQRAALRFRQIVEHRSGSPHRRLVGRGIGEAEPIQSRRAKMPGQGLLGAPLGERPGRPAA